MMSAALLPPRLLRASVLLLTSAGILANGPMGGSGSAGQSQQGGQGPMMPPDLSALPTGNDAGASAPDAPGPVPYPPSGPDRATTLIEQLLQIGNASRKRDQNKVGGDDGGGQQPANSGGGMLGQAIHGIQSRNSAVDDALNQTMLDQPSGIQDAGRQPGNQVTSQQVDNRNNGSPRPSATDSVRLWDTQSSGGRHSADQASGQQADNQSNGRMQPDKSRSGLLGAIQSHNNALNDAIDQSPSDQGTGDR